MSKSNRIGKSAYRQMLRLLGECRELGDDPVVWRRHFMQGVARLIDADLAAGGEMKNCLHGSLSGAAAALWGFDHGFNLEGLRIVWEWNAVDPEISELWVAVRDRMRAAPHGVTVARPQVIANAPWERTPDCQQVMRTLGADAVVHSFHRLPHSGDEFDGVCWFRARGRADFDEREVALISMIHREAARLVGGPLARFDEPRPSQLPPRMRQVLRALLEGEADKQIAARLNLSPHTVNHYTKGIFIHFRVQGRTELLARWVRRGWGGSAAWESVDDAPMVLVPQRPIAGGNA